MKERDREMVDGILKGRMRKRNSLRNMGKEKEMVKRSCEFSPRRERKGNSGFNLVRENGKQNMLQGI